MVLLSFNGRLDEFSGFCLFILCDEAAHCMDLCFESYLCSIVALIRGTFGPVWCLTWKVSFSIQAASLSEMDLSVIIKTKPRNYTCS